MVIRSAQLSAPCNSKRNQISSAIGAAFLLLPLLTAVTGCHRFESNQTLLAEAQQYRQKGENKAAIIELKNVLQNDAKNMPARVLLGEMYIETGNAVSAEKEFRKALSLGASPDLLLPLLGQSLLLQGAFEKILAELKPDPKKQNQSTLILLRANAYLGIGNINQARDMFEQLLKTQADFSGALLGLAKISAVERQLAGATDLIDHALLKHPADIDCLFFKGDLLWSQRKYDAALGIYRHILTLRPENTQAQLNIANINLQSGKLLEAKNAIDAARKTAPQSLMVFYTQAMLDYREGKYKSALEGLQRVLRVAPEHMPSLILIGSVEMALGSMSQAEQHLQKFLASNPHHVYASKLLASIALKNGKPELVQNLIEPLLPNGQTDVELLALAGQAQLDTKHYSNAVGLFRQACDLAPASAALHTSLGLSELGASDNPHAIIEFERAISLGAVDAKPGIMLVMMYLRVKDYDKAMATVASMEKQHRNNPLLYNLKGSVLVAMGKMAAARSSFEQALARDPGYIPALESLAQLDLLEKKPQQARQRFETALAKDKKNINLMTLLARLAMAQNDTAQATQWLERASHENPDAIFPALALADFYAFSGQKEKALLLAQKLQAGNPSDPEILTLLAKIQYSSGSYDAAFDSYSRLAAIRPASSVITMQIAKVQLAQNQRADALASYQKALTLKPDALDAQVPIATLLMERKSYQEALRMAQTIQKQRPTLAAGFKLEGDVLMAQGQSAVKAYERAFEMARNGPLLIKVHQALVQDGKTQEADKRITQWLQEHPRDVFTRLYFASDNLSKKQYKTAIDEFNTVLLQEPNNVIALNNLAISYQQEKDQRALAFAERAYKLAATSPAIIDTLGWILLEKGDTGRAMPLLQQATSLAPKAPEIRYHLGLGLIKTGDRPGAKAQFQQILSSSKDYPKRDEVKALLAQW